MTRHCTTQCSIYRSTPHNTTNTTPACLLAMSSAQVGSPPLRHGSLADHTTAVTAPRLNREGTSVRDAPVSSTRCPTAMPIVPHRASKGWQHRDAYPALRGCLPCAPVVGHIVDGTRSKTGATQSKRLVQDTRVQAQLCPCTRRYTPREGSKAHH